MFSSNTYTMSTYEISKSSLLSLKAEILRKQEEVNRAKLQNRNKRLQEPKKLTPLEVKNKGVEQRDVHDICEDEDLLRKSREVLESKAKLYDKLSNFRKEFNNEENDYIQRYLVRFDKKSLFRKEDSDEYGEEKHESDEEDIPTEYEPAKNPDEEWVEYTDCLGRTRTCMRKDLEFVKSKDAALRASVENDSNKLEQLRDMDSESSEKKVDEKNFDEKSELLSADMRREMLRSQWEKEEEELAKKANIHYQDVLFNEARTHGVGYYAFSKDEEERARQQEALKKLRQETQQEQKKAQELKLQRERQLTARIKAAKNRKRARLGLPPEEDEPEITQPNLDEQKEEGEEEQKRKEELEKQQIQKAREMHVRPWDVGKEGVKEHYIYSQEEWVKKKRTERPKEFAPPEQYSRLNFRSIQESHDHSDSESSRKLYFSTKKQDDTKSNYKRSTRNSEVYKSETSLNPYKSSTVTNVHNENSSSDESEEDDRIMGDYDIINNKKTIFRGKNTKSDAETKTKLTGDENRSDYDIATKRNAIWKNEEIESKEETKKKSINLAFTLSHTEGREDRLFNDFMAHSKHTSIEPSYKEDVLSDYGVCAENKGQQQGISKTVTKQWGQISSDHDVITPGNHQHTKRELSDYDAIFHKKDTFESTLTTKQSFKNDENHEESFSKFKLKGVSSGTCREPSSNNSNTKFQPVPIMNECEDKEECGRHLSDYDVPNRTDSNDRVASRRKGAEIAPPATFEYYGPSGAKKVKYETKKDIEESISAGLKFLRQQFEKKKTSNRDSEMFIM